MFKRNLAALQKTLIAFLAVSICCIVMLSGNTGRFAAAQEAGVRLPYTLFSTDSSVNVQSVTETIELDGGNAYLYGLRMESGTPYSSTLMDANSANIYLDPQGNPVTITGTSISYKNRAMLTIEDPIDLSKPVEFLMSPIVMAGQFVNQDGRFLMALCDANGSINAQLVDGAPQGRNGFYSEGHWVSLEFANDRYSAYDNRQQNNGPVVFAGINSAVSETALGSITSRTVKFGLYGLPQYRSDLAPAYYGSEVLVSVKISVDGDGDTLRIRIGSVYKKDMTSTGEAPDEYTFSLSQIGFTGAPRLSFGYFSRLARFSEAQVTDVQETVPVSFGIYNYRNGDIARFSIKSDYETVILGIGEEYDPLEAVDIEYYDGIDSQTTTTTISFTSSDENIARIENGKIVVPWNTLGGNVTITAESSEGDKVEFTVFIDRYSNSPQLAFDAGTKVLSVENVETSAIIQFWVRQKVELPDGESAIWMLMQSGTGTSYFYEDAFEDSEYLHVIVRAVDNSFQVYKTLKAEDYYTILQEVEFEGQNYFRNEVIYLPQKGAQLKLFFNRTPQVLSSEHGEFSGNVLNLNDFENTGSYIIPVQVDGLTEYLSVIVYDNSDEYAYITDVSFDDTRFVVDVEEVGGYTDYTVYYYINNETSTDPSFTLTHNGYYYYNVTLKDNSTGKVIDTYTGYFNYNAPENDMTVLENRQIALGDSVAVGAVARPGKEYKILRWDAFGEYVIKEYSGNNTSSLTIVPLHKGIYRFDVYERTIGSDASYECKRTMTVTVGDTLDNYGEIFVDGSDARSPVKITVINDNDSERVLYKYVISAKGLYKVLTIYSPSNTLTWIPAKPGDYTIEVRIISNESYGYADSKFVRDITIN